MTTTDASDLDQLRRALAALKRTRAQLEALESAGREPIALVGIGCRLPGGANTPDAYWELLRNGVDAIVATPPARWDGEAYFSPDVEVPGKGQTRQGGFIEDVDAFDAEFFGISPREAVAMDPQQRLILEVAWEALEDAGIVPATLAGSRTGVFIGIGINDYGRMQVPAQRLDPTRMDAYSVTGNALCITANRLSYLLDLRGPSMAIDTACSSSLVAVHQACQSLRIGDSTVAIVGGINLMLLPDVAIGVRQFLSPEGRCHFGDARADGYVRGEGALAVVLKTLRRAQADGDSIYALIRGSAVNQDGYSSGLTVPNGVAQQAVLRDALRNAGVNPADVDYVEAHGTGTALGDPIELNALHSVLSEGRPKGRALPVGSVKTNIGHLEAGAGLAGLVKVALALKHGLLPPSLNYATPNPHIPYDELCTAVQTTLSPWPDTGGRSPIAGVSSFGFGGTNAHAVLEGAPTSAVQPPTAFERPQHVVSLSARTEDALRSLAGAYGDRASRPGSDALADLAHTANTVRSQHDHRAAVTAATWEELRERLARVAAGEAANGAVTGRADRRHRPKIAFLFTGQGSQFVGMGRSLYETQPVFREALDRCARVLDPRLGRPLLDVMWSDGAEASLDNTAYTQPALFALEYALAQLWRSWGIEPAAVLGHSVGEYVAACMAGVFSLEDGLTLIAERARLMSALPTGGAMAALFTNAEHAARLIEPSNGRLAIAAINGPANVVISGEAGELDAALERAAADRVRSRRLTVSHAFHSALMEPMLAGFERAARGIAMQAPQLPVISNVTGRPWHGAPDAGYWARHVRATVQFSAGIEALRAMGCDTFIEIGPAPTLVGMGKQTAVEAEIRWLPSLRPGQDDWTTLLGSLSTLYVHGAPIDWAGFDQPYPRRRVPAPTYPFQHQRYWVRTDMPTSQGGGARPASAATFPGTRLQSPAISGAVFELRLESATFPWLDDHQAHGRRVVPATALIDLALAAGAEAFGAAGPLRALVIREALLLPDGGGLDVQTVLSDPADGRARFEIFSRRDGFGAGWTSHALGEVGLANEAILAEGLPTLSEALTNCVTNADGAAFYAAVAEQGMSYGPAFRMIRELRRGERCALARIERPDDRSGRIWDPPFLDACLQGLGAAVEATGDTYLPIAIDRVMLGEAPRGSVWSYARIDAVGPDTLTGTVFLYAEPGICCGILEGIRLKRASREALRRLASRQTGRDRPDDNAYTVAWEPMAPPTPGASRPARWLILADDAGEAEALADRLKSDGASVDLAFAGSAYAELGPGRWSLRPGDEGDLTRLLDQVGRPEAIVHFWSLDIHPEPVEAQALLDEQRRGVGSLLALAHRLPESVPADVWLVTRGAQPVPEVVSPAQAPLWGFARTLARERTAWHLRRLDLDPSAERQTDALLAEVSGTSIEDEVALRMGGRYAARLVRRALPVTEAAEPRHLVVEGRGQLEHLVVRPAERRAPGTGEIEIRIRATGLNFRDVLNALGLYPGEAGALGHECAGVVSAVGPDVAGFVVGDRVMAIAPDCFATYTVTPALLAVPIPSGLGWAEAATVPIAFLTAWYGLRSLADLQPGERVLIHAAAGGVGLAAVQIAQRIGAEVYATVGSPAKRAHLEAMGVRHIFNSRTLDFADEVLQRTDGAGVDVVLNSLTGDFIPRSLDVLRRGGRFVEIGKRDIWTHEQVQALNRDLEYFIVYLGDVCDRDPALVQSLFRSVADELANARLLPLPHREFALAGAQDAFRYMAGARHIGKVVILPPSILDLATPGTILITGGLGGLGLVTAQRLVELGARDLVLVGRHAPTPEAQTAIESLTGTGARVRVFQGDVSLRADIERILGEIDHAGPPLRGVIHAAGALADGLIDKQTWTSLETAMAPKILGAWNLHAATRGCALDFFVMFSAGATLLGMVGQANYAGANAYLDALAAARQAQGLPALSIAWGAWAETGMAARLDSASQQRLQRQGIELLAVEDALLAFERALRADAAYLAILTMDWARFAQSHKNERGATLFDGILDRSAPGHDQARAPEPGLAERLNAAAPSRRRSLMMSHLQEQAGRVLGLDAGRSIDPHQPLQELGMDSLMAVELRNALGASLARSLPATLLFDYPTLDDLAGHLLPDVAPTPAEPKADESHAVANAAAMADVASLSEDEAEALLLAELAELKGKMRHG